MDKYIQDFIAILVRQNRLLDSLVELGEEKRKIIILGQVEQLDKLMQKEGIIVSNLEKLEGARFKLQGQFAQNWGVPVKELTANVVLVKVKELYPFYTEDLQVQIDNLSNNINRLRGINSENNELLNMSLDYIEEMQSLLTGDIAGTYSRQGQQVDETTSRPHLRILDKKA